MFPNTVKALKNSWPVPKNADINNGNSGHVETVVLMSKKTR